MGKRIIEENLLQELVDYLAKKPYIETEIFIQALIKLPESKQEKLEADLQIKENNVFFKMVDNRTDKQLEDLVRNLDEAVNDEAINKEKCKKYIQEKYIERKLKK